jgi:penicillin-binding protein-related factor A (putative recombinase)
MKETVFQNEIRKSIKFFYPMAHYKKIPDPSIRDINQTAKRPYDSYYVYKDIFIAIECKQMKKPEAFPFMKVENHQVYNLLNVRSGFNVGLLLINYRFLFSEKQMEKYGTEQKKHNFAVVLDVKEYTNLIYMHKHLNKKSIPFQLFWQLYKNNHHTIMHWEKINNVLVWNIKKIFDVFEKKEER